MLSPNQIVCLGFCYSARKIHNVACIVQGCRKWYSINIPELAGATCLASVQGWLLVFQEGLIFFFCPFSGAKIDLPQFPRSEFAGHIAAFSGSPTSKDCVVSVINKREPFRFELNVLARGNSTWTTFEHHFIKDTIFTCAFYHEGSFYYIDKQNITLNFSLKEKIWRSYKIIQDKASESAISLPFGVYKSTNNKTFGSKTCLFICGTILPGKICGCLMHNESVKPSPEELDVRSFNAVWIQPRFHQIPKNLRW